MQSITLTAPDISCAHCVATVKQAVGDLSGVDRVEVDPATKRVEVAFDPARLSQAEIESALAEAGYPVQV
ncbi:MAG TPA: heavy-metal-associated domain-containing protein [Thermomicrobiales bacterium]|nr:heavy-metal-associated domain-containing protein [Thermomicrobiales bacterium]